MDLPRALAQIRDIHAALDRAAVYRGYRAAPIAASGLIGIIAAAAQPASLAAADPIGFVTYWTVIAAIALAIGSSEIVYNYFVHDDDLARRGTREAIGQLLPGLAAGALITIAVAAGDRSLVRLLPAFWSICFALGVFGSVPYLPRGCAVVGVYYLAAGAYLLWVGRDVNAISGWHVGAIFGAGLFVAAGLLYFTVERETMRGHDDSEAEE
jgi:hypothetical protein